MHLDNKEFFSSPRHTTLCSDACRDSDKTNASASLQITGEDRNQLMKLQYRIGKLELDNMELEQSRIVHESAMRGKDLTIQKLQLQVETFGLQHVALPSA